MEGDVGNEPTAIQIANGHGLRYKLRFVGLYIGIIDNPVVLAAPNLATVNLNRCSIDLSDVRIVTVFGVKQRHIIKAATSHLVDHRFDFRERITSKEYCRELAIAQGK